MEKNIVGLQNASENLLSEIQTGLKLIDGLSNIYKEKPISSLNLEYSEKRWKIGDIFPTKLLNLRDIKIKSSKVKIKQKVLEFDTMDIRFIDALLTTNIIYIAVSLKNKREKSIPLSWIKKEREKAS